MTSVDLTPEEHAADLTAERLKQLVGLVDYDVSTDPFPVTALDAVVFVSGNATQSAHFYRTAFGMQLVAYAGPETGNRDHKAFVLRSGSARFVIIGGVSPSSAYLDHHRRHGDGVIDIALEVPDVDKCIAHARAQGATILDEPRDINDEHGTVRVAALATYGDTQHTLVDRSRYRGVYLPGYVAATSDTSVPTLFEAVDTAWAMSNSAAWTTGWASTTGSWAS
jgi:4-hydroxyphenylpyruvate dioxygenase